MSGFWDGRHVDDFVATFHDAHGFVRIGDVGGDELETINCTRFHLIGTDYLVAVG